MMKRSIYIFAIFGVALIACNKQEYLEGERTEDVQGQPIMIGPSVRDTKVMVGDDSDIQKQSISLYGWTFLDKANPDVPSFVMNNVTLGYTGAN